MLYIWVRDSVECYIFWIGTVLNVIYFGWGQCCMLYILVGDSVECYIFWLGTVGTVLNVIIFSWGQC